jgi:hypothetical protein
MVYLKNTTEAQPLFVPKSRGEAIGDLVLTLRSTVGLEYVIDAEEAIDLNTSQLYHRIAVVLPEDVAVGEYEYELSDDAGTLSTGLAFIGDLDKAQQTDNTIQYEQTEI